MIQTLIDIRKILQKLLTFYVIIFLENTGEYVTHIDSYYRYYYFMTYLYRYKIGLQTICITKYKMPYGDVIWQYRDSYQQKI